MSSLISIKCPKCCEGLGSMGLYCPNCGEALPLVSMKVKICDPTTDNNNCLSNSFSLSLNDNLSIQKSLIAWRNLLIFVGLQGRIQIYSPLRDKNVWQQPLWDGSLPNVNNHPNAFLHNNTACAPIVANGYIVRASGNVISFWNLARRLLNKECEHDDYAVCLLDNSVPQGQEALPANVQVQVCGCVASDDQNLLAVPTIGSDGRYRLHVFAWNLNSWKLERIIPLGDNLLGVSRPNIPFEVRCTANYVLFGFVNNAINIWNRATNRFSKLGGFIFEYQNGKGLSSPCPVIKVSSKGGGLQSLVKIEDCGPKAPLKSTILLSSGAVDLWSCDSEQQLFYSIGSDGFNQTLCSNVVAGGQMIGTGNYKEILPVPNGLIIAECCGRAFKYLVMGYSKAGIRNYLAFQEMPNCDLNISPVLVGSWLCSFTPDHKLRVNVLRTA